MIKIWEASYISKPNKDHLDQNVFHINQAI